MSQNNENASPEAENRAWLVLLRRLVLHPLPWILLICLVGLFLQKDGPHIYADSLEYKAYDKNIFLGESHIQRVPGYPLFIQLAYRAPVPIYEGDDRVVILQVLFYLLTVVFFYLGTRELVQNRALLAICTLVLAVEPQITQWVYWILTESLSVFAVVLFYYLMVTYIKRPAVWRAALVGGLTLLMVMLRPAFIYLLVLLVAFWVLWMILRPDGRRSALAGLVMTLLSAGLIWGYCYQNYRLYGFFTLSRVADVNRLEQIFNSGIYENGVDEKVNGIIAEFMADPYQSGRWHHSGLIHLLKEEHGMTDRQLHDYAVGTLSKNRGAFIAWVWKYVKKMAWNPYFAAMYVFCITELVLIAVLWIRFRSVPWLHWGVWGVLFGMLFVVFWGAYADEEYPRLMSPVLPMLLVVAFRYLDMIYQYFRMDREHFADYVRNGL